MATYSSLLTEKQFLKVQQRARALNGANLKGVYYDKGDLVFKTLSGTDGKTIWTQKVQIQQLDVKLSTFRRIDEAIRGAQVKVSCDCPAFLFWGFKYIAWKKIS